MVGRALRASLDRREDAGRSYARASPLSERHLTANVLRLAFEFFTNRAGRRDKDYALLNLGVTGSFTALTVHDQLRK
jgi:hypothetical protein